MQIFFIFVLTLGFGTTTFAACYAVYDKFDKVVYKSSEPPFDLSIPISEGIKSKYPGGYLIQSEAKSCSLTKENNVAIEKRRIKQAFDDRRTKLQLQNFSEVSNDRVSVLPFPKEKVIVSRSPNISTLPIDQSERAVDGSMGSLIAPRYEGRAVVGSLLNNLTINCPTGSHKWVDSWGNQICKEFFSGNVKTIQGNINNCPTGTHRWVDDWGNPVCQSFDSQQQYYDTSKGCPIGSHKWVDNWGNPICEKF